jgi:hypothetical protein
MTFQETQEDGAQVSVRSAIRECKRHGAIATVVDNGTALVIVDGTSVYSGDVWGKVRVYDDGTVNAASVLSVLGY